MTQSQILPNGRVLRYSFHERVVHWITAISYVYLLLTGLAFWSPWLFWMAIVLGGPTVSRELHPWAGLVFVAGTLVMYRMWAAQMRETPDDKKFWDSIGHYVRNEDDLVPSADRFNAGQVYMGTAMERGAFGSVIRGDVSPAWAKKFHRVWYDRLLATAPTKK